MARPKAPDPLEPTQLEVETRPTVAGRIARWLERARILREWVEAARARHGFVDLGFDLIERDSTIGGGILAGALAYRLFAFLLPTALLLVSGLGLYAGTVDRSTSQVAKDAGLHGLVATEVAAAASGRARGLVFLLMLPVVAYTIVKLYKAIAIVHAITWYGSGRGVRITRKGIILFVGLLLLDLVAVEAVGWIRRRDEVGGLTALLLYLALVGGSWLVVSTQLPHRDVRWQALVPGAVLVGAGLLFVNVFNVYVTARLVEDRADTYGALGVATALLLSLVIVGRLIVGSAVVNASLEERRRRGG
jgi:uncharacterized BrkB/YihY/UPF0761 family membrane protein